ncbi:MAG TPA: discoidin domain-containing protein [Flavisolibacter sp.]|nr:discoidin domain-containing protein [Flavisolibacter sp.]
MKPILFCFSFLLSAAAFCQAPPKPYGALPSAAQLKWHEMEMYGLIHYGVDTYTDKEWGFGDEDPALLNPSAFSAEQIVSAAKAGGLKGVIVVAKHHDGLCLWPTKTTTHNITKSPWKGGKGDMLKEFQLACQKLGMKLGVYCSPWDRNSPVYGSPEYVAIYREQLKELYSNYGPLFISWHDGANGGDGYYGGANEKRNIDRTTYYGWEETFSITRKMQPSAVIFGDIGPDVRWVGNEEGFAGETSWATFTPEAPDEGKKPANGYVKYWLSPEGTRNGKYWMPAECDVPLRPGWFYHASQDDQVKSSYTLLDLYYKSVGRGANFDLGLAPDKTGRMHPADVKSLKEFGELVKNIFRDNLAKGAKVVASNVRGRNSKMFGPSFLLDNDRYSYWTTDDDVLKPELTIELKNPTTFNVIRLRENIKLGQRITSIAVDAWQNNAWKEVATATSIGANRLMRLPQNITAQKLRLRVTGADACPALSDFGLFKEPPHLTAPVINRNREGLVQLQTIAPVQAIRYTTDGTEPTQSSPRYSQPFLVEKGGTIKAKSFEEKDLSSAVSAKTFGLAKRNWKVRSEANADQAKALMDENSRSIYEPTTADKNAAKDVVIDLGKNYTLTGFTYLPRQDKRKDGIVEKYLFSVSSDGSNWKKITEGEFANISANPLEQTISFETPGQARYIKFSALSLISGEKLTIAELGVLVKEAEPKK